MKKLYTCICLLLLLFVAAPAFAAEPLPCWMLSGAIAEMTLGGYDYTLYFSGSSVGPCPAGYAVLQYCEENAVVGPCPTLVMYYVSQSMFGTVDLISIDNSFSKLTFNVEPDRIVFQDDPTLTLYFK